MKYKAVKLRESDHAALAELLTLVRVVGVGSLPKSARGPLADGVTAGSVVAASVAMLREHVAAIAKGRA